MKLSSQLTVLNQCFLIVVFFVYALDCFARQSNVEVSLLSIIKNAAMAGVAFFMFIELIIVKNKQAKTQLLFTQGTICSCLLAIIFFVLSMSCLIRNGGDNPLLLDSLFRLILPPAIAFLVVNLMKKQHIHKVMIVTLFIMLLFYLLAFRDKLTINNFLSIDYLNSYSPFESHFFSPPAIALCLWFCFDRSNFVFTILSVFFLFLTFKRFMIIFAIFLLLFGSYLLKKGRAPKWVPYIIIILFISLSFIYTNLMLGKFDQMFLSIFHKSVNNFTMGRQYFFLQLVNGGFTSYGFNSSTTSVFTNRSIEMDIPQYWLEMGLIAVISLIILLVFSAGRAWYSLAIISFCLIETLTSHWMDITYFWIFAYIVIGITDVETRKQIQNDI